MNLEKLIEDTYGKHQAELKANPGDVAQSACPKIYTEDVEKLRATLNRCGSEIKAISESEVWRQICQKLGDAEEAETFLEDVVCLLGDAMGCVDEVLEQ